jgi:hypothetical protein
MKIIKVSGTIYKMDVTVDTTFLILNYVEIILIVIKY